MEVPITTNPSGRERSVLNSQCRSFEGVQAPLFSVSLSHRRLELQIRFCALHFDFGADHRPASVIRDFKIGHYGRLRRLDRC